MTIEQDIQRLEGLVKRIEDYINQGIWNSDQQKEIQFDIDEANTTFDRIITAYINISERPSFEQASLVSNLQERLHHFKHNLPSPPSGQDHEDMGATTGVIIYTSPT